MSLMLTSRLMPAREAPDGAWVNVLHVMQQFFVIDKNHLTIRIILNI